MSKITVDTIMSWNPCPAYTRERIEEIYQSVRGRKKYITAEMIYNANIPDCDKIWVLFRKEFMNEQQILDLMVFCLDEVVYPVLEKYHLDDKSIHDVERIKKLLKDKKITNVEFIYALAAAINIILASKSNRILFLSITFSYSAAINIILASKSNTTNGEPWAYVTSLSTSNIEFAIVRVAVMSAILISRDNKIELVSIELVSYEKILNYVWNLLNERTSNNI